MVKVAFLSAYCSSPCKKDKNVKTDHRNNIKLKLSKKFNLIKKDTLVQLFSFINVYIILGSKICLFWQVKYNVVHFSYLYNKYTITYNEHFCSLIL